MSDRDEEGEKVTERLSERFGGGESDESDEPSESDENGDPSEPAERSKPSERSDRSEPGESDEQSQAAEPDEPEVINVKEDWKGRYMYIPPAMHDRFDEEYERLRYECGRDLDWKPKKNKHYYPVVVAEGIDDVADMNPLEFADAVVAQPWFDGTKADLTHE